jgi:hypothetical protein
MEKRKQLDMVLVKLDSDFQPWGKRSREEDYGPDCSYNCKHFLKLEGYLDKDWGVCKNRHSPRRGLLTFEHQGCKFFEETDDFGV